MRPEDRLTALWRLLLEQSVQGRRVRRRGAASAAMAAFVVVLLVAAGLGALLLLVLGTGVACGALLLGGVLAHRHRSQLAAASRAARSELAIAAAHARARGRRSIDAWLPSLRHHSSRTNAVARRYGRTLREQVSGAAQQRSAALRPIARQREALRANATGVTLRRRGSYAEAAEHHRLALELFRGLGDRSGEALTLNNLALALDRAGDSAAIGLLEEAAKLLDELGDRQHEGQVMANLALAFRRRGRQDESREVLDLALERLAPDSSAYSRVEELRRAS